MSRWGTWERAWWESRGLSESGHPRGHTQRLAWDLPASGTPPTGPEVFMESP